MAVTPQHGLLGRLLDYVVEQSKEIDPGAYTLTGASDFRRYPKDFAALPGVDLDLKLEGDHIWLQVQRLETHPAPRPSDTLLRRFISVSDDPNGVLPQANEVALKYEASTEAKALGLERAAQADSVRRAKVDEALRQLRPLWLAWAEGEKPRRRSIELYGDLFMLKGRLEAEETAKPSELVWGIGVSAWKFDRQQTENEAAKSDTIDYQYPLLTQAVEIELDPQTHCIAVRPRAVPPRLEFDAFGACQVMGAAEVEKQAKLLLTKEAEHPVTPFDVSSFEPILKLVAGSLCRTGRYEPDVQSIPSPGPDLLVTSGWVLLIRERSSNFLVEDIRRLKTRILAGDPIPAGPIALVTPPSDEVIRYESISFRGMCGGSRKKGEPRELYFPLPYNQEQETIVEMLERAPGVAVQGPPGTGKTHTIANIICHYLATGRKVLVTSKGEHALEVLQSKIPEEVRPLSVALLSGDKEGMRQFQASIEAIIHNLSQLNPRITEEEIERCRQQIDAAHSELSGIDRRVNEIAEQQLANVEIDGVAMRAQKMAELVISGQELHGWFDDSLTLGAEHAPPLTAVNAQALRDARRRLGSDLHYVAARLPSSQTLLPTETIERLHNALVAMREIDAAQGCGDLWALRAITPEVLEDARRLLASVEAVTAIVRELEELNSSWVFELRSRCRRPEYASECDALKALFGEIEELVKARAAFLQRPVQLPAKALDNPKVHEAVEKAKDTGKPFSLFAFGMGDVKPLVAAVRISGQPPASQDDWLHVHRYLGLHARVLSFSVRWNQFADLLSMPTVQGTVEALRSIELVALAAMKSYTLATVHDVQLPLMAGRVFSEPPTRELQGTSAELSIVRKHLRQHLTRAELAAAATQLATLQEKLAGTSGPVAELLHTFTATDLGNPEVKAERAVARYAELVGELKRIESLASHIATVNELCRQVEFAGGQKLAARLRTQALAASGEDNVLPVAWREAWNWARVKSHLDTIDAREELLALSSRRRDLERLLAQQYERLVARSAWLGAKSQASAKVLSALESYRTAIRKIGQGTGPNATRYRRDAQKAMQDAQGAIPCWIMSHSKVSESMPGQLGAFDLVIVDEASQSNLWALPAILRGKKILVVGDDKQVSPEGGFISAAKILSLRERFLSDQAYAADLTPEKSLYDIASTVFAAQKVMLAEHFRCVHPIIAYSNRTFYKNQIKPLRVPKASERIDPPLIDVYVTTGERSKKDANRQEAEFIAAEIESILRNPKLRHRTLGVVSLLGLDQAQAIDTLVRSRCDAAELLHRRFECGDARIFQGSERDIMFLSMVADSRSHHALSGNMFEQRFNVAASRARDRMYLVRSVKFDELSAVDIRRTLLQHFSKPMDSNDEQKSLIELCESGFERDVYTSLFDRGYRVTPQVKAGAFRIDMVVEGGDDVRLAIECDGDEFHGPDRWQADMQRQRILERAGWVFWRCFASTWSLRKSDVLKELVDRMRNMGIEPLGAMERSPSLVEYREWPPRELAPEEAAPPAEPHPSVLS
ncbi:AAA domain-containing protein [Acidovorax sp. GBBC 3334]|uniref:AAA domain-containing protein n=1 Tax=Acidovorax sp. GBBC 3334 TaxID=2940496 RepID=UPI0023049C5F|nr:AAA domain-containing protein [Acidovorax sp. GBBC 3334]MDA8456438.1 AAA domain-containing protein [Acidovorax sp. GBBC 3334]